MTKELRALLEKKEQQLKAARTMVAAISETGEDFTEEQQTSYDAILSDINSLNARIDRERVLMEQEATMQGIQLPDEASFTGGAPRVENDPRRGFNGYGEFCSIVANAGRGIAVDQRLLIGAAAPSTFGGENVGADGGFLVPPEFSQEIWGLSLEGQSLIAMTDNTPLAGNSMTFPSDETTPWGTDGIRAYWEDEAAAATETKPKLTPNTMRLKKLVALVPVSDELMVDAAALPAYLTKKTGESIRWKSNDALVNGNGVGRPLGIANSAALVSQAKETSQTADTINWQNATNMFSRMPGEMLMTAVWLISNDAYPQLPQMTLGNNPIFLPASQGAIGSPAGTLLGRPIIMTQSCQTVGDLGDIYLADFNSYRTITKAGGIETATSMHLYFDANAMAFRATFRIDGQPILSAPIDPAHGSTTLSPYVALAARA
jgi:HK97 family phage major capsid protein